MTAISGMRDAATNEKSLQEPRKGPSPARSLGTRTVRAYVERLGLSAKDCERYLNPRLSHLTPPEQMADRAAAASRLARAVRGGERIVVFGDYDCDGMTATAILSDILEELGGHVSPLIANRFDGGYGVSRRALARILAEEPQLVVTCDCGSSDHETLAELGARGVDVIVIDHHLVPERPLPVLSFLNPHRPDCAFPEKGLASCGLVLSVAAALRKELGAPLDVRRWLDLVAIGSIADVAPLMGDNRVLVRAGLLRLQQGERPGLRALLDLIGVDRRYPLVASDVAFRIAPRLNAPGRLGAPDAAFALLREKDPHKAALIAAEVEQACQRRRDEQGGIEREAEQMIASLVLQEAPALVLGKEGWNHGIVGIVAGRLAEKYGRPALVIGFEKGVGRGSVRGPAGFPLFDALCACGSHLVRFGGHQAAAGMEIHWERLDAFREAFEAAVARTTHAPLIERTAALRVDPKDDVQQLLEDLYLLEPCGEGNRAPELSFDCEIASVRELNGGHLKLMLTLPSGRQLGGFAPNMASRLSVSTLILRTPCLMPSWISSTGTP